jgi:uncharacterized protein (DUF1499 family)
MDFKHHMIRFFNRGLPLLLVSALNFWVSWVSLSTPAIALSQPAPLIAMGSLFSISGDRPTNLGIASGGLVSCPSSPNCVNSTSPDLAHKIDPLPLKGTPKAAIATLKEIIQAEPRTKIVTETDNYLYAEFTSALMGFVDDVEFYVDMPKNEIQVRSASRLGESDLGVNRKRIETIRSKFTSFAS